MEIGDALVYFKNQYSREQEKEDDWHPQSYLFISIFGYIKLCIDNIIYRGVALAGSMIFEACISLLS